jgi:hypothetical protein
MVVTVEQFQLLAHQSLMLAVVVVLLMMMLTA